MNLSIIIPAYNEENYISQTLHDINQAVQLLENRGGSIFEVIVVDNNSTDYTGQLAKSSGAVVLKEPIHNIARVRNTGARCAKGDVLIFIDADAIVPATFLTRIAQVMSNRSCVGGSVDIEYCPERFIVRTYLRLWRALGKVARMVQGAVQFCRRDTFLTLGGYDESIYMGEDVFFFWRLQKTARERGMKICSLRDIRVIASSRRFDQWPLWRILVWTNPLFIFLFRRTKVVWKNWYSDIPR